MAKKGLPKSWIDNLSLNSVAWTDPGCYYDSSTSSTITMSPANAYKETQSVPRKCFLSRYFICILFVVIILFSVLFGVALFKIVYTGLIDIKLKPH